MAEALTHTNHDTTALDLNDGTIYRLVEVRGIYNDPEEPTVTPVPYKRPVATYEGMNPTERMIEIELIVYGRADTDLTTNLRALRAHFHVDARDDEMGVLDYTNLEGVERCWDVIPWTGDAADVEEWVFPSPHGPGWARLTITLRAPDPTCWDPTPVTANSTFNGVAARNVSLANAGDEEADVYIEIAAPATANWSIADSEGRTLTFEDDVAGAETLEMWLHRQRKERYITHSVDGDWHGKRASGSEMPFAPPGTNDLIFTGGDAGDNGVIAVTIYPRYSSM